MVKTNIIGIAGSNGSGKDTIGAILVDQFQYIFVSVTDALRAEARRRGMEENRASAQLISAEWRREYGLSTLIDKVIDQYHQQLKSGKRLAMASLRHPAEADRIHELGGLVLWIDADPRLRYNRIQANAAERNRPAEDNKTFEQFLAEEEAEMHRTGDEATLDVAAVKAKADIVIINNFGSTQELAMEVANRLGLLAS